MRRRVFWIALPLAVVLALWMGPGLDVNDEMPAPESTSEPQPEIEPTPAPECETPPDPGPDGDR
jgi:hypothetical protein